MVYFYFYVREHSSQNEGFQYWVVVQERSPASSNYMCEIHQTSPTPKRVAVTWDIIPDPDGQNFIGKDDLREPDHQQLGQGGTCDLAELCSNSLAHLPDWKKEGPVPATTCQNLPAKIKCKVGSTAS